MQKTSLRVAGTFQKFKKNTPPEVFWHQFEQGVKTYHLSSREAVMVLHALITEHPRGSNWYANNVQECSSLITLAQVKNLFYAEFLEANWQTARLMELMDIRYQPKETVKDFVNRFSELMQSNEFGWAETNPERAFLKHVLFYKCPYSVQRIIGNKTPNDYESCSALAADLGHFVGIPTDIPPLPMCAKCRKPIVQAIKPKTEPNVPKHCNMHGKGNHTDQECYRHKDKQNYQEEQAPKKRKNPDLCWAKGCEEIFTPEHAKVCAFRKSKNSFKKTRVESDTENDVPVTYEDEESDCQNEPNKDWENTSGYDYDRDFFFNMT